MLVFWHSYARLVIALAVAGISALIGMNEMEEYQSLVQPPLAPPSWLFPVVWTVLFTLMGISAARVYIENNSESKSALWVYGIQLVVNALWTFIYFTLNLRLVAFVWLLFLLALVVIMTIKFWRVDKTAGYLQLPYIAWLIFAGYLNLATYILNG